MAEPCPEPSPASSRVSPLFRPEVLAHVGARRHGAIVLAHPLSHAALATFFGLVACALVAFLALFSVTRKAEVAGVLAPARGLVRVATTQSGIVERVDVREGQPVRAGDALFVVASERASATRGEAARSISGLLQSRRDSLATERGQQRLQATMRVEAAARRADDLDAESRRIGEQVALQVRRVALADDALQRYAELQASRFVSAASVQERQGESLDQRQRLADLERARAANGRDVAAVRAELRDLRIQSARDDEAIARNIAALEQDLTENEARREVVVRAPRDGVVTGIAANAGQSVAANQPLATILPAGSALEAELYAPSRAAGFVRPGMVVLVRYPAYPYQKFGQQRGVVREVSSAAMRTDELALPANGEPLYRIRVVLDRQAVTAFGDEQPLKAGMAVDASVLLESRRLYEWVLEPLYSISGRSAA